MFVIGNEICVTHNIVESSDGVYMVYKEFSEKFLFKSLLFRFITYFAGFTFMHRAVLIVESCCIFIFEKTNVCSFPQQSVFMFL